MNTISYPIAFPDVSGPVRVSWQEEAAVAAQDTEFTLQETVYAWEGQRQTIKIETGLMTLVDAKKWWAWHRKLNGKEGTFIYQDFVGMAAQGSLGPSGGASTPLVNGANQNGNALITDGWVVNKVNMLLAGDWVSLGDRLHSVLDNVSSNGSGQATLNLWPFVRNPANNAPLLVGSNARGVFRMIDSGEKTWTIDEMMDGFSFSAHEDL